MSLNMDALATPIFGEPDSLRDFLFENGNLGVKIMDFTLESFDLL